MRWSLLFLLLAGCATPAGFRQAMESWVGQPADRLISEWGPPQSSYPLSSGGAVLQWASSRNTIIPVPQQIYGTVTATGFNATTTPAAYNIHLACAVRVTVSPDGFVQSWNSEGNHCIR